MPMPICNVAQAIAAPEEKTPAKKIIAVLWMPGETATARAA
jgi:hypothetical protein